ncbi:MAG: hypothetical protein ABJB47_21450 [Actinomycetota bacterium]
MLDGAGPDQVEKAQHESRRCRAMAWTILYQIKLLSDDPVLLDQPVMRWRSCATLLRWRIPNPGSTSRPGWAAPL